jgi:phosphotransferase system enzyme I (PtsI)
MERKTAPTESEQYAAYQEVLVKLAPKEVVIRTLDVGGDKPISYLPFPKEENPFLGLRALRYCLAHPDFFKVQIRALLKANTKGNLSILLPMVCRATEAAQAAQWIQEWAKEIEKETGKTLAPYRIGAMIEIPSLVFELPELAKWVSFVSVGTNDLLQYLMAVDRMSTSVAYLYNPYSLGFIRLMKQLADSARSAGLELGICGELGGDTEFIPLWVAMGYKKLSQSPGKVLENRKAVSSLYMTDAEALLKNVLSAKDESAVKQLLVKE